MTSTNLPDASSIDLPPASARERVSIAGVKVRLTRRVFRFFRLYLLLLLSYRPSGHFQIGSSQ